MLLVITALGIIGNVILGLLVLQKNPKNSTNRLFFLLNITIIFWSTANYFSLITSGEDVLFWIRLVLFFAVSLCASFLLLIKFFPNGSKQLNPLILYPYLALVIATMAATLSPYVFTHVEEHGGVTYPIPGPLMPLFALMIVGSLGTAFGILIYKFIKARDLNKAQLKFILLGTTVMFVLILSTIFFPVVFFGYTFFVRFSPVYTYSFVGAAAYAIIKHRMLDINMLVAKSVAFTLLILVLASVSTLTVFSVGNIFFNGIISFNQAVAYSIITLILAFSTPTLKKIIEILTDKIFFRGGYDSDNLLSKLTKIMAATLDLDTLARQNLKELTSTMRLSFGAFLLFQGGNLRPPIVEGGGGFSARDIETVRFLTQSNRIIIFEEEADERIKQIMREMKLSVVLPLSVGSNKHGVLVLGEKKSGEIYSSQDIKLLEIFGPEVSVAIQNSLAYEEIKRFNITLKDEVQKATQDLRNANTNLMNMANEVYKMNHQLRQLDKLKDDFVSIASHELRTPMTAIRSYSWMALYRPDAPLSPKMKKYIERIYISTERLINLVNDMLNISRIESGRIEITPEVFDMAGLINEVIGEVEPKSKEKALKLLVAGQKVPKVFADIDKVHQVLLNLVGNAMKFTPNNGSITVSLFSDGQVVEVSVKDTGVGISAEDRSRLFQKFGRLDNSYVAAATSGGTGLGLYISKSLIELMEGRIWVNSEGIGKGTTFTFSLPAATPGILATASKYKRKVPLSQVKTLEPVNIAGM